MSEKKVTCLTCKAEIIQATAIKNRGLCAQCIKGTSLEDIADGLSLGIRILRGVFFSSIFAVVGYAAGSVVGAMTGIFVAVPFATLGFVYGCFCSEINSLIRVVLSFVIDR